jgi:predicted nucleic acid-binding protein
LGSLIDSSIFVAVERGDDALGRELASRGTAGGGYAISAITAAELLHGVHRATTPAQEQSRSVIVEHFLATIPILPFDLIVARYHARVDAGLQSRGIKIGRHDLAIAATALAHGLGVVTRDKRSFHQVAGLTVDYW